MLFFFIELLRKWNYNVGGELDNLELNKIAARWPAKAVAQLSFSQ